MRVHQRNHGNSGASENICNYRRHVFEQLKLNSDINVLLGHFFRIVDGLVRIPVVVPYDEVNARGCGRLFHACLNIHGQRDVRGEICKSEFQPAPQLVQAI